jgi:hypothetical protein
MSAWAGRGADLFGHAVAWQMRNTGAKHNFECAASTSIRILC